MYFGKVQKHFREFIDGNIDTLKEKNVALFLCASEKDPTEKNTLFIKNFPEELRNISLATDILGHSIYLDRLNPFEKILFKFLKGTNTSYEEFYKEKIEDFTKTLSNSI